MLAPVMLRPEDLDMARRRLQQKGDLYQQGGWWKLRWKVDALTAEGKKRAWSKPVTIGPATKEHGLRPLTKTQAERIAWDTYLSKLDHNQQTPLCMMTLEQFVEQKFLPGHVAMLKGSGKSHYSHSMKHILPALGSFRLCDIRKDDVQQLVSRILNGTYSVTRKVKGPDGKVKSTIEIRPYSVQTAKHIKTTVSAIFTHAESEDCFVGTNPAKHVRLPEMKRAPRHALTFDQVKRLVEALAPPASHLVLFAVLTSMNVAEICGLRWRRVNLSNDWSTVDGEALPPFHIAVREQWYRGEFGTVKAAARRRNIPVPKTLVAVLEEIRRTSKFTAPDDLVFSSRNGTAIDEHNIAARHLKPAGTKLGMPWVSWHCFRHTHSTLTKTVGLSDFDRMGLMGHSSMAMTDRYTHLDTERRRAALDEIGAKLITGEGMVN